MKENGHDFDPFSNMDPDIFSYKKGIFNWEYGLARTKLEDGSEEEESFSVINSQRLWCGCAVYIYIQFGVVYNVCIWLQVSCGPNLWVVKSELESQRPGLNCGLGFH